MSAFCVQVYLQDYGAYFVTFPERYRGKIPLDRSITGVTGL